jgi:hypothetical protein
MRLSRRRRYRAELNTYQRYLVQDVAPAIRSTLKAASYDEGPSLLLGYRGRLYNVCIDYQVSRALNSALRAQVVASAKPYVPPSENTAPNPLQLPLFGKLFDEPDVSRARRKPWAWLLRHVFAIDVNVCPKCAGPMKWREVALTQDSIRAGLARAGLSARGPPKRQRVPLGQLSLPFPKKRRA